MDVAVYYRVGTLPQTIHSVPAERHHLFYSQDGKDAELGCIGHLRGDFAKSGNEFWTTWWPHCEDYKTQEFKDEFDGLINSLREDGLLKNRSTMAAYCAKNKDAELRSLMGHTYGFEFNSSKYTYYLRCFTEKGDYNFYCYCYDKAKLEEYLKKQETQA